MCRKRALPQKSYFLRKLCHRLPSQRSASVARTCTVWRHAVFSHKRSPHNENVCTTFNSSSRDSCERLDWLICWRKLIFKKRYLAFWALRAAVAWSTSLSKDALKEYGPVVCFFSFQKKISQNARRLGTEFRFDQKTRDQRRPRQRPRSQTQIQGGQCFYRVSRI